ncbi:MAG: NUDIX hydrolase [Pseudonocardiaceae bacterium]
MPELIAAGAVLWRRHAPGGGVEVAVVHRPRYDDWSWPKGKAQKREPLPMTAVREVAEETGHTAILGPRLGTNRYPTAAGEKVAHYWAAQSAGGCFTASEEVDELRWLSPGSSADLLTYPHDRMLLAGIELATAVTGTVALVRHAKAGQREKWDGEDALRPLSTAGRRQAEALRELLPLFGARRVHSAPLARCRQTVEHLAVDLGIPVIDEPLLSEEGYAADPRAGLRRLIDVAAGQVPAVVCSQGGVIPDLLSRIADKSGLPPAEVTPSRKGSFWVLSFGDGRPAELTLLAADYYEAPLS